MPHLFISILRSSLLPFIEEILPGGHLKHCSKLACKFYKEDEIKCWTTLPETPNLNPIENLWHELKEYIRRVVKPTSNNALITGNQAFWKTVTVERCQNISATWRSWYQKSFNTKELQEDTNFAKFIIGGQITRYIRIPLTIPMQLTIIIIILYS